MIDWERVERLRAKGDSWDDIAADEKVGFTPPPGSGSPGLALKSLYFQRRSRRKRVGAGAESSGAAPVDTAKKTKRKRLRLLAFVGILVAIAGAIPFLLSYVTSLVGALGVVLYLGVVALVGVGLLGVSVVIGGTRALSRWKGGLIGGVVAGVVLTAAIVSVSIAAGCPNLATTTTGEPGPSGDTSWGKAANPVWTQNGEPVVFFLGSIACPYCSASSWAIYGAIQNFSTSHGGFESGADWGVSNPGDVYPDTPEIRLNSYSASGPYIAYAGYEGSDPTAITVPSPGCPYSDYVSTYDSAGSIPFFVIGGIFVHTATIVSPTIYEQSSGTLTPQQVYSELVGGGYSACDTSVPGTILCAQDWIEAYMWKADVIAGVQPPPSVEADQQVASDFAGIH